MGAVGVYGGNSLLGNKDKGLFERYPNKNDAIRVVNPNFNDEWKIFGATDKSDGSLWSMWGQNCALCSTAGILQLMGYDVEAMPYDSSQFRGTNYIFETDYRDPNQVIAPGDSLTAYGLYEDPITHDITKNWKDAKDNPNKFGNTIMGNTNKLVDFMKKSGANSYGELVVAWKNDNSAHSMVLYRDKTNMYLLDFQSHEIYSGLNEIRQRLSGAIPEKMMFKRLDNAKFIKNMKSSEVSKIVKQREKEK